MLRRNFLIGLSFFLIGGASSSAFGSGFYLPNVEPRAPFFTSADEEVRELRISSGSINNLQQRIDDAREENPEAVLIIRLRGNFEVRHDPLKLGSRMNLVLAEGASLTADSESASHVVEFNNASQSGIYGLGPGEELGVIDGNTRAPVGVLVRNSEKIHFYHIEVRDCLGNGIEYSGRGADKFGRAGSIVGCTFSGNYETAVRVNNIAQFVFTHNVIRGNEKGIEIDSHTSIVADNIFLNNAGGGVFTNSENGVVARNTFGGEGASVTLSGQSQYNLVTYNSFAPDSRGASMAIDGKGNSIYYNEIGVDDFSLNVEGEGNIIASHRGLSGEAIVENLGDNIYFNPPTRSNPHDDEVIVQGMGRRDIEIDSGGPTTNRPRYAGVEEEVVKTLQEQSHMDLSEVQRRIDEAREESPDDYLVVHMRGLFLSTEGLTGLEVPDFVSVILDGSIVGRSANQARLVLLEGRDYISFSGGHLDGGGGKARSNGLAAPGSAITVIDGVTVSSGRGNGISMAADDRRIREDGRKWGRGRARGRPVFVRGNSVSNMAQRGIWGHLAEDTYYIDNGLTDNNGDGIDIDGANNHTAALFNTMRGNTRSGVFLEEGVHHNIVYGNYMTANRGRHSVGVLFYSSMARRANQRGDEDWGRLRCRNNVIVGNLIEEHNAGIATRYAGNCVFMHNIIRHNNVGVRIGSNSAGNYFALNALYDNNIKDLTQREKELEDEEFYNFSSR